MGTTVVIKKSPPQEGRIKIPAGGVQIQYADPLLDADFLQFCADNPDLRVEQDKNGKLLVMPPVDTNAGLLEDEAHGILYTWRNQYGKGRSFSPSTGFKLPDGSIRSADGAWVSDERLSALPAAERKHIGRLVPDFVIEVRSATDRLSKLQRKMTDVWIKNGVRLAWLLDPKKETAYIYRANGAVEVVRGFDGTLSGEDVCPGLVFDLKKMRL